MQIPETKVLVIPEDRWSTEWVEPSMIFMIRMPVSTIGRGGFQTRPPVARRDHRDAQSPHRIVILACRAG